MTVFSFITYLVAVVRPVGNIDLACLGLCDFEKDDWALVDDRLNYEGSQYHDESGTES